MAAYKCLHIYAYGLLLLVLEFRFIYSATVVQSCKQDLPEKDLPIIRLSGVDDLKQACDEAIRDSMHECHKRYVEKVREAYFTANCYKSESVQRVTCCALWEAKSCLVTASANLAECGPNITEEYRALPSNQQERDYVLDQCSEYGEDSAICQVVEQTSFTLNTFITVLLILVLIPFLVMLAMKLHDMYQEYQHYFVKKTSDDDHLYGDNDFDTAETPLKKMSIVEEEQEEDDEHEKEEKEEKVKENEEEKVEEKVEEKKEENEESKVKNSSPEE